MHTFRMVIITLIFGLLCQSGAYAEQPRQLEAKEGYSQFPFFDTKTPVWSYNGQIPGPLIRGRVGTTMVIDFANRLKGVLIVEDAEKQPWSKDWVWLLDDWLRTGASRNLAYPLSYPGTCGSRHDDDYRRALVLFV